MTTEIESKGTRMKAWIERNDVEVIIAGMALILATIGLLFDKVTSAQWFALVTLVLGYIFGARK